MSNRLRGAIAAALLANGPLAQASEPASAPASSASSPQLTTKAAYRSVFDGYRRFDQQKVQPWREINDNVRRISGWQAYARESAGDGTVPAASAYPASMPQGGHSMPKNP